MKLFRVFWLLLLSTQLKAKLDGDLQRYACEICAAIASVVCLWFCVGRVVLIKIKGVQIVDGRVPPQYDVDVKEKLTKDQAANLMKAYDSWAGLVENKAQEFSRERAC